MERVDLRGNEVDLRGNARRLGWLIIIAGVTVLGVVGTLSGWGMLVAFLIGLAAAASISLGVYFDSKSRRRSGWVWLVVCIFLPPIGFLLFLVVAVTDRARGCRGLETRWDADRRWYDLTAIALGVAALALVFSPVTVDGGSVTTAGGTSSFSGSCSSALEVVLGQGPYADATAAIPAVVSDLHNAVATRCATAAGRRVAAGFVCLAGALGAVLLATLRPRRLRRRSILNHVSKVNRRAVVAGATAIVGAADKSLPPDGES